MDGLQSVILPPFLSSRFHPVELLAQKPETRVIRARPTNGEAEVVLKLLSGCAASQADRARFRREAESLKKLDHPNVVRLYEWGEGEGGVLFIVLEYVRGTSLERLLDRHGLLAPAQVLSLAKGFLSGLGYIHDHGIVHRDLSPANLLVSAHGNVKIIDLGIAVPDREAKQATGSRLTWSGAVVGTPSYIAPERILGAAGGAP